MLSAQEMSDRFEIQDLIFRYSQIIDSKDFDALASEIFTADAHIDYSVFGGTKGGLEETVEFLKQAMTAEVFPAHQHLNANLQICVDGDTATGRVMCFNPQELAMGDGSTQLFMLGLWYVDKYVRTARGWRMCERVEEKSWVFNTPDFMEL